VDENPYRSPHHADASVEASMEEGEEILFQIAARSLGKRSWVHGLDAMIGKFIVTNRRVMFLSSGTSGRFGITYASMERRIVASVDFRAVSEESSWEFELSNVRSVETRKPSFWRGRRLELTGTDRFGAQVRHKVLPAYVTGKSWKELVTLLTGMKLGVATRYQPPRQT